MWIVVIALAAVVTPLIVGRMVAKAVAEQTTPRPVRGPSLDHGFQADRLAVAANVARMRVHGQLVHMN